MATKTITIKEDAYKKLKAKKKENESFSDVINREFGSKSIRNLIGTLSDKEAKNMKDEIKERRKETNKRRKKIQEKMNK